MHEPPNHKSQDSFGLQEVMLVGWLRHLSLSDVLFVFFALYYFSQNLINQTTDKKEVNLQWIKQS